MIGRIEMKLTFYSPKGDGFHIPDGGGINLKV